MKILDTEPEYNDHWTLNQINWVKKTYNTLSDKQQRRKQELTSSPGPATQSACDSVNRSAYDSVNVSVISGPANQSVCDSVNQSTTGPVNQSAYTSVNQHSYAPAIQSTHASVNQSACVPAKLFSSGLVIRFPRASAVSHPWVALVC